jgi:AhpD family alkylhydroperoxidase
MVPLSTKERAMRAAGFDKRIFSVRSFLASLADLAAHFGDLRDARRQRRVSKAFAEKIMLAVTQVNGCRYCSYAHSLMALKAGVSDAEVAQLLAREIGSFPKEEAVALAFAQHYAERGGRPEEEAWRKLEAFYGPETARSIMSYIRMITIGNLFGNTVDAFLSRLAGKPARDSNALSELAVLTLGIGVPVAALALVLGLGFAGARRLT